jgi:glyoxylase-like metal-dependent hydrolase (beta-lactamase superfamily II)
LSAVGCAGSGTSERIELQPVAPGVWMARGSGGEVDPANRGRIGNAAVIAGPRGALVIDSGVSRRHGQALLEAARRVVTQPLRALLLTHVRQEAVFGAAAFQDAGLPVAMHPAAARLMRARCEGCLKTLQRVLGAAEMAGSRVVVPDRLVEAGDAALGALIGRPLRLLAFGPQAQSSGPGDLAVWDEASGTLVAGGLLDAETVPDVQDADFAGWRQALAALAHLPGLRQIVPGHGPLAPPVQIGRIAAYLDALEARTAALLAAGTPLSEVADATDLPAFAAWDQYDTVHRRNASIVYLRQERELLRRPNPEKP